MTAYTTELEADQAAALAFADECLVAFAGYGLRELFRHYPHNPRAEAAGELVARLLIRDRTSN